MKNIVLLLIIFVFGCGDSRSSSDKTSLNKSSQKDVDLSVVEESEAESSKVEVIYPYRKDIIKNNKLGYAQEKDDVPVTDMELYLSMYSDEELANVVYLAFVNTDVTEIKGLERLPNLENLRVVATNFRGKLKKIDNIPPLEKLYNLDFYYNQIEVVPSLAHLPALTGLSLEKNPIRNLEWLLELEGMIYINTVSDWPPYREHYSIKELLAIVDQFRANNAETLKGSNF